MFINVPVFVGATLAAPTNQWAHKSLIHFIVSSAQYIDIKMKNKWHYCILSFVGVKGVCVNKYGIIAGRWIIQFIHARLLSCRWIRHQRSSWYVHPTPSGW